MKYDLEHFLGFLDLDLQALTKHMEEIAGAWNGKDSGHLEERASVAKDIQEKVKELRSLLDELEEQF